jgi:hypothetical protein
MQSGNKYMEGVLKVLEIVSKVERHGEHIDKLGGVS